jgi:UDP-4-amino-4,6-dideoxy-N-acetyl-beta-L-altrosamine transaminase
MIPYGRQDVTQGDIDAVVEVLRSDFLTQGPAVPKFEHAVAAAVGARYATAVNSATSALHIACLALGLAKGERLWTVPNTFVASANCGRYCGADVDFVDIDPMTWNLSTDALEQKLKLARQKGALPKVLVPVHFAGQPTEQEQIWELAKEYGFKVLEDASHSIGASRNSELVGSCRWSHITVFSFHPVKIVTSGEGGMTLTNDRDLAERMAMFRSHGITRDPLRMHRPNAPPWHYEQQMLGFNYRMTDIHAVLGISQLRRLPEYVASRNALARRYDSILQALPLVLPTVSVQNRSAFHLYVVRLRGNAAAKTQSQVMSELRQRGVGVNLHYAPVHLQPYYRELGFAQGDFPQAEAYGTSALTLPLFPGLTIEMQDCVVEALRQTLVS